MQQPHAIVSNEIDIETILQDVIKHCKDHQYPMVEDEILFQPTIHRATPGPMEDTIEVYFKDPKDQAVICQRFTLDYILSESEGRDQEYYTQTIITQLDINLARQGIQQAKDVVMADLIPNGGKLTPKQLDNFTRFLQMAIEDSRRVKVVEVTLAMLTLILHGKLSDSITLDVPEDLEVISAQFSDECVRRGTVKLLCRSMSFDPVLDGEEIPVLVPVYTRTEPKCDVCGCVVKQQLVTICAECRDRW